MRLRCSIFAILLVSAVPMAAYATPVTPDTISDYNISATLSDGSVSGLITFDETTGDITGGDFNVTEGASVFNFDESVGGSTYDTVTYAEFSSAAGSFQLTLPGTSLANYTGGPVCGFSNYTSCPETGKAGYFYPTDFTPAGGSQVDAGVGSLTPTPEPSSLALLGTGLLGVAGVVRRKFVA